jgi:hypothetical protein
MKRNPSLKVYPFLLATYPIFALWNFNIIYVDLGAAIRSLAITLVGTAFLWLILKLILRNGAKAGLLTTLAMLMFFSYGHLHLYLKEHAGALARHSYLLVFFGGIFLLGGLLVIWKLKSPAGLERFLTITGVVLIGYSIIQLTWYQFLVYQASLEARENVGTGAGAQAPSSEIELPDIYLIILDAHTSTNVLKNYYGYDNQDFIDNLTEMGFFVGDCSQSNYPSTKYSLFSVMNLNYIQEILKKARTLPSLKSSVVAETLKSYDYTIVAFENRARGHFDLMEDEHLFRNPAVLENTDLFSGINEFESMLIETSLMRLLIDLDPLKPNFITGDVKNSENYEHYLQTLFILDELERLPEMKSPKFVFAHILVPHDPFIFTPTGEYEYTDFKKDAVKGYRNNVAFIDNRLPDVLRTIIDKSEVPPIIVVMGDHGPMGDSVTIEQRMSILNAYYAKDEAKALLYDQITPVNSFRVIFNQYFDTEYPILDDTSYYAYAKDEFADPIIVPNTCGGESN